MLQTNNTRRDPESTGHVLIMGVRRVKIDQDVTTGAYRVMSLPDGIPGGTEDYFPDPL